MVASLRLLGHDVLYVSEAAAGLNDVDVIALATSEKRILLTEDKDFGDLAVVPRRPVLQIERHQFAFRAYPRFAT